MSRLSKTLGHIGSYFMLSSLVPIMIVSVFMMSIKQIALESFSNLRDVGEWLKSLSAEALNTITSLGITLFSSSLIIFAVITFFLIFINSRKAYKQRIGYFVGLAMGFLLIIISFIPFIIVLANSSDGITTLLTGLLFIFGGISGLFIGVGSFLGMIGAKTYKEDDLERKK